MQANDATASAAAPIAALVQDLFFASAVRQAAARLGRSALIVEQVDALGNALQEHRPALLLIDLGLRRGDWADAVRQIRDAPSSRDLPIVAFGPHRDLAARDRALAAGCTAVVANSRLAADLPGIVAQYAAR